MRIKTYFSRGRLVINKAKANRQIVYHILYENCSFELGIEQNHKPGGGGTCHVIG